MSSAAPESASSAAAASNAVEIPFVVVPELTVRYVDMVQVVNVQEGSTLNVREGPGTDYASIGKANPGESFEYLGDEGGCARSASAKRQATFRPITAPSSPCPPRKTPDPRGQPAPKRPAGLFCCFPRLPQAEGKRERMKSEMDSRFYAGNRQTLYDTAAGGTVSLLFSRQSRAQDGG